MAKGTAYPAGNMKSQHTFAQIPTVEIPRSTFNRSHGLKTSFDAGFLVPIFVDEALPGDTMNLRTRSFARLATPLYPVMDNMFMDFFFFAVPNRLVWDNWQKFCGEQEDPGDSTDFTIPRLNTHNPTTDSLSDYFGLPVGVAAQQPNSLHYRAYNLIWSEWFRDENMQDSPVLVTTNTSQNFGDFPLRRRGKRHDYFTSCLPFTQKGDPISLPLGTQALVKEADTSGFPRFRNSAATTANVRLGGAASGTDVVQFNGPINSEELWWDGDATGLVADLSTATAATINDIREAFQIQRLLERDARGGTRYTEICRSHFGVISSDQRLQRPEYLGGGSTRVNINPVAATTGGSNVDVGVLAGFGTASQDGAGFVKSFTEHCLIIGLVNVRADITYQQGIDRMWSRQTRYDYFWPSLAHLGEQAVLNQEIMYTNTPGTGATDDQGVFGYQERFAEYRYKPSRITGIMRSDAASSLDAWHLGLDFASLPGLNSTFIEDNPPIDRVIQVTNQPHFIADFFFKYTCARPMPTFGVPGMIDHF